VEKDKDFYGAVAMKPAAGDRNYDLSLRSLREVVIRGD
jgi:hypothetical protein